MTFAGWRPRARGSGGGAERTRSQQSSAILLRPLSERSQRLPRAPPPPGFPRRPSHLHGAPLPRCHWPAPGPALPPLPSLRRRVPSPERPELRAAGGLLNRGGGVSRGGSGARSGDESAAPRVGGGGRTARDRLGGPHHGRTEGAAAEGSQGAPAGEWPASQRRAEGGGSPPSAGDGGGAGREERRRPPGGLAGSASAGQSPCTPNPAGRWIAGPGTGPCFGAGVGPQPNLNG